MGKSKKSGKTWNLWEKRKTLTLCSNLELAGGDVVVDVDEDEWEPRLLITDPCDSVTVSKFKPGKRGLNSRLKPILRGGVSVLTHYLITWLETDGQLGTRDGSSGRPGALLKIFFPTQNSSTPYLTYKHCFLWLEKTNIADTTTGDTVSTLVTLSA